MSGRRGGWTAGLGPMGEMVNDQFSEPTPDSLISTVGVVTPASGRVPRLRRRSSSSAGYHSADAGPTHSAGDVLRRLRPADRCREDDPRVAQRNVGFYSRDDRQAAREVVLPSLRGEQYPPGKARRPQGRTTGLGSPRARRRLSGRSDDWDRHRGCRFHRLHGGVYRRRDRPALQREEDSGDCRSRRKLARGARAFRTCSREVRRGT